MTRKSAFLAVATLALVSGCGGGSANNSSAESNSAGTSGGSTNMFATAPSAGAAGGPVDRNFVTGHWGVGGDCSRTLSFNGDGTVSGGELEPTSRWTLEGNTLSVTEGKGRPEPATASRQGNNLSLSAPQGQQITLTRCASAAAPQTKAGQPKAPAPSN